MEQPVLTISEIEVIVALVDAGLKATGLQVFRTGNAQHLHVALAKLQSMAGEAAKAQGVGNDQSTDTPTP